MKTRFVLGLLASAALLASVAGADAKMIGLKAASDGSAPQTSTATFSGSSATLTQSNTINSVVYTITGTTNETTNNVSLGLTNSSTNTFPNPNNARTVNYYVTVTGLSNQPTITDWTDLFSGTNAVFPTPTPHTVSNAEVKLFYDPKNHAFAGGGPGSTATLLYDSGSYPSGCGMPATYNCSASGPLNLTSPLYSLTEVMTITYKQNSNGLTVTSSSTASAIPEPASLALLGSGLLLAGWMLRRRRNDKIS